jgi:hypothetical protein
MFNYSSSPALTDVTFSGNSAGLGGGMFNYSSSPALTDVTFGGNSAYSGGGMYNASSNLAVQNSILWGNTATAGPQIYNSNINGTISDSIVQGGCPSGNTCTHIITADPLLGALGSWGGTTQTIPLLPGSSAIDAGNDAICPQTDQRGVTRAWPGNHCDIGAFESRGFTLSKSDPSGDNQSAIVSTVFANPLRVTVSSAYGEPVDGGAVTFSAPSSGASTTPATSAATISGGVISQSLTANNIPGSYLVTAGASGAASPASFVLANVKADTMVSLTSSANPSTFGQSITFTATVSIVAPGGGTPTGTVDLYEPTSPAAPALAPQTALASQPLVNGLATFTVESFPPGEHTLLAVYHGDELFNASTSAIYSQTVNAQTYIYYFPYVSAQP